MSVTALHVLYKKEFEPIVRPMENVAIAESTNEGTWKFYKVKYIEPFYVDYTTPSITNGSSTDVDVTDLELGKNEIGQIRILLQTNGFEIEVKLPEAIKKFVTKNLVSKIDSWLSSNYPHLTELFYMEDNTPKFTVYNNSGSDGSANIKFIGFRYILEQLGYVPKEYTVIYVYSIPPRVS